MKDERFAHPTPRRGRRPPNVERFQMTQPDRPDGLASLQALVSQAQRAALNLGRIFGPLVENVNRALGPIVQGLNRIAPVVIAVGQEFAAWDRAKALRRSGWLSHYTMPFDKIAACWPDSDEIQRVICSHYEDNWEDVRSQIERRLSNYVIDDEARATFHEALDGCEARRYRSVCRVLFPEIERVARTQIFDGQLEIAPKELVERLVGEESGMGFGDVWFDGFYELCTFDYVSEHIKAGDLRTRKGDHAPSPQGLYTQVKTSRQFDAALANPIPNRHAAIHGLVAYATRQNALNAIFIADYMFAVISRFVQAQRAA